PGKFCTAPSPVFAPPPCGGNALGFGLGVGPFCVCTEFGRSDTGGDSAVLDGYETKGVEGAICADTNPPLAASNSLAPTILSNLCIHPSPNGSNTRSKRRMVSFTFLAFNAHLGQVAARQQYIAAGNGKEALRPSAV